jgi:cytoskeletal protein CcmA (bactofilin family)
MFGKPKTPLPAANSMNQFGAGTIIQGEVAAEGDIRIDGKIIGNVSTKSKLVIGATGIIEGDVYCQNGYIDGKITGKLQVEELLILSKTAQILGDISIKKLVVEEGARLNGKVSMGVQLVRNLEMGAKEERNPANSFSAAK